MKISNHIIVKNKFLFLLIVLFWSCTNSSEIVKFDDLVQIDGKIYKKTLNKPYDMTLDDSVKLLLYSGNIHIENQQDSLISKGRIKLGYKTGEWITTGLAEDTFKVAYYNLGKIQKETLFYDNGEKFLETTYWPNGQEKLQIEFSESSESRSRFSFDAEGKHHGLNFIIPPGTLDTIFTDYSHGEVIGGPRMGRYKEKEKKSRMERYEEDEKKPININ